MAPTRVCDTTETTPVVSQGDKSGSQSRAERESYEPGLESSDEIEKSKARDERAS